MMDSLRKIPPNPPRWQPNPDPSSIHVPGLDTNAPALEQIEQIEQLITIKLQNVDETFSKIHHVLSNKILPAVKRYAVGTEPVREAAKFWTSFYEQAAQIRIPTYDDFSTLNDQQSRSVPESRSEAEIKSSVHTTHSQPAESTVTSVESSFLPAQAAYSSTPAMSNRHPEQSATEPDASRQQSWTASIDSDLASLDEELRSLGRSDPIGSIHSVVDQSNYVAEPPVRSRHGKGKQPELLLRQALHSNSAISTLGQSSIAYVSPLKFRKPQTPVPKKLNPYLPPDTNPADWSGIVDLAHPSLATPRASKHGQQSARRNAPFRPLIPMEPQNDTTDDSFDGLPAGMSPPILMSPARPPRSSAELILGKTPTREAAERITRDLISDVQRKNRPMPLHRNIQYSGIESSMSTLPTPPSLTQYRQYGTDTSGSLALDSSLEHMMERVGLRAPPSASSVAGDPGPSTTVTPLTRQDVVTPVNQGYQDYDDGDFNSDDSLDDINNTAHPSAAFLMASRRPGGPDDSFDSNDSDDDDDDVGEGLVPVHPFARGPAGDDEDGFDDSFDDPPFSNNGSQETETLFGVPPQQRLERRPGDQRLGLVLLGQQGVMGGSSRLANTGLGEVQDSPTPAAGLLYDQSSLH